MPSVDLLVNQQIGMPCDEIIRKVIERNEGRSNIGVGIFLFCKVGGLFNR